MHEQSGSVNGQQSTDDDQNRVIQEIQKVRFSFLTIYDIYWNKAVILCSYRQNVDCSVISEVKYFSVSVSVSVKPLTFYSMHPYFS